MLHEQSAKHRYDAAFQGRAAWENLYKRSEEHSADSKFVRMKNRIKYFVAIKEKVVIQK